MPALERTDYMGRIEWLGAVDTDDRKELLAVTAHEVTLTFAGLPQSVHGGETRASCSRVTQQYPKGTTIRNVRQLSIVSAEEMALIAADIGLETLDPARLGASVVISGIPDLTHLPPSSRLQTQRGTTLVVDMLNLPCHQPARSINVVEPGAGAKFVAAAAGRRGVTAWVERPGPIAVGDDIRLHVPVQRAWSPERSDAEPAIPGALTPTP